MSSRAPITLGEVLLKQRDTTRARAELTRAVTLAQGLDTTALRMATALLTGLGAAR